MNFCFWILFFLPTVALAQDFFSFLTPKSPDTAIEVEGLFFPEKKVDGGPDKSHVFYSNIGIGQKVYDTGKDSVILGAKWSKLDLNAQADLLRDYYNIQGSVAFRRITEHNRFWSASLSYGSASDEPFRNGSDGVISGNYLQQFNQRWFGILNYSNNRAFLNNIPLPGFFYVKEMTREKALIIGFPIIYWMTPLNDEWSFRYFGVIPWSHRFRFLYSKWRFIMPYMGYEQSPQSYFRHDRENQRDRFFWFERKLLVGIEGVVKKGLRYDFNGGLAFDRQFFEARNFSEKKNFLFNMENGLFVGLTFRYNF